MDGFFLFVELHREESALSLQSRLVYLAGQVVFINSDQVDKPFPSTLILVSS